jgi:cytoskeletal protein CcmA (bactofilin family)
MEPRVDYLINKIYKGSARSLTMKQMIRITSLVLLALLVFIPLQSAAAMGPSGPSSEGQVIFGQSFTLKSGETLNGDLLVFGGSAALEQGSTVNGNVVLFGGSLVVDGEVSGDVAVTGGSATIGAAAHLHGDLTTVGATLERADGAQIDGQITNTATSWVGIGSNGSEPVSPAIPAIPATPAVPNVHLNFDPLFQLFNAFGQAFGLAVLAMLVMLFLAPHADRVAHAVMAQPLTAGSLGLLTLVVAPITLVLLTITLIFIPVVVIAVVALFVAAVFGWIAIGYEIGQRLTTAIHQNWHPAFSAGLGVFALTLVANALTSIPVLNCVGWLAPFLLGLAGLGAVIMTRFGTQAVLARAAVSPGSALQVSALAPVVPVASEPPSSAVEPSAPQPNPPAKKD